MIDDRIILFLLFIYTYMRFVVIDGSGFLYRAYHGLPILTNADWRPVQAIFGFVRMMCQLLMTKPDRMVIVRDAPVKTLRHIEFAEYKANRPSMPDEFKRQITTVKDIVSQLCIPYLEVPGYEADDIIATLVTTHQHIPGIQIQIASWDKDLKQLLSDSVVCIDPMKQETTTTHSFREQFGFDPIYMIDYLSLVGDSSDNIPWVAGIGPKWATELIKQYGTIESMYESIDTISPSLKEKLLTNKVSAIRSKQLIVLMDVPGISSLILDQYVCTPDFDCWYDILVQTYGFHSLSKTLDQLKKQLSMPIQESLF